MARKSKQPYECPCCGYKTEQKSHMKKHLYTLSKPCPQTQNALELTEDIKEHILSNRVYIVPKPIAPTTHQTINQTINNYNTINNFIANMDFMDKLSKYIAYNQIELLDYGDKVEAQYYRNRKRLEKDQTRYVFKLSSPELMDIVDKVSSICNNNFEELNILFDEKTKKLKLFEGGEWETLLQEAGITKVIYAIKDNYLDMYECYLVRRLNDDKISAVEKSSIKEHLFDYYKFISCFNIDPYIKGKTDEHILKGTPQDSEDMTIENHTIADTLMPQARKVIDSMPRGEIQRTKKEVLEIIKRNSKQNIDELNKKVAALFNMDESFKTQLLERLS